MKQLIEKICSVSIRMLALTYAKLVARKHVLLCLWKAVQGACFARFPLIERTVDHQLITVHEFPGSQTI